MINGEAVYFEDADYFQLIDCIVKNNNSDTNGTINC